MGGLMSYGPKVDMVFRRVAYFVDKALRGLPPVGRIWSSPGHDMPDTPENPPADAWYELVINLNAVEYLEGARPPVHVNLDPIDGISPVTGRWPLASAADLVDVNQ
jgi:hypothetical protein